MKKIVGINVFNGGSTGHIMVNVATCAEKRGYETYVSCSGIEANKKRQLKNQIFIGNGVEWKLHIIGAVLTGLIGCFSPIDTFLFLRKLDKIKPDILHLHNLHGWYINLPMLFRWIKKRDVKVVWTLHDCWSFTGHCPHFTAAGCHKWKTKCCKCSQYRGYPQSRVNNARYMYKLKKKWFTGVKNMTIVTPSEWLAGLVKESFLKDYEVRVINNGIDLNIFKPTESDLRKKLGLYGKKVIMGCADSFGERKGFDVFLELAKRLDDSYKIVLVGLSKEKIKELPENIIGIERTANQQELSKYYTMADVFANPTREDNFPTVNMEALACGTPVVTFKTGGSPEMLDETCGSVTPCDDVDAFEREIIRICEEKPYSAEACRHRAENYDMNDKFLEYVEMYEEM